jgi:hypothetical protein
MKVVGGGGVEGGAKSKIQDFDGCKNMAGNLFQSDIFYADNNIIYVVHCCLSCFMALLSPHTTTRTVLGLLRLIEQNIHIIDTLNLI